MSKLDQNKFMERESEEIITVKYVIDNPNKGIVPSENKEVLMSS